MKILLTGASGFIGSAVKVALETAGHQVTRLSLRLSPERDSVSRSHAKDEAAVEPAAGQRPALHEPSAGHRRFDSYLASLPLFDAIVHCGWAGVRAADRDDVILQAENPEVLNRLMAYCRVNPPGIFISFGSQAEIHQRECAYAKAKARCLETLSATADEVGMRWLWLRLFSVYGPGESPEWLIPSLTRKFLRHEPVALTPGEQEMDYLHVNDVAAAVLAGIHSTAEGVYEVGSGHPVKLRDVVETIHALAGSRSKMAFGALPYRPGQVMGACADPTLFSEATGWWPRVDFNDGLAAEVVAAKLRELCSER